jgi:hypothetical protein
VAFLLFNDSKITKFSLVVGKKLKIKLFSALFLSFLQVMPLLSPRPARSHPAVVAAPAICAGTAGAGCILVFTAVVSGVVYQVWQLNSGKYVSAISGLEAVQLGNAHWVDKASYCKNMAKRNNWKLLQTIPANGGGFWCIFEGQQTDFGDQN